MDIIERLNKLADYMGAEGSDRGDFGHEVSRDAIQEIQRLADEAKRANASLAVQIAEHTATLEAHAKTMTDVKAAHEKAMRETKDRNDKAVEDLKARHETAIKTQEEKILSEHPLIAQKRAKLAEIAKKHAAELKAAHAEILAEVKAEAE